MKNGSKKHPTATAHLIDPKENYWPTGLIPYDPTDKGTARFTMRIPSYLEQNGMTLDKANLKALRPFYRKQIIQTLRSAKNRNLELRSMRLEDVESAYRTIVEQSITEFLEAFAQKYPKATLPEYITMALQDGSISTAEDLIMYIKQNEAAVLASIPEDSKTLAQKKHSLHILVRLFQERFDIANERLISLLELPRKDEEIFHTENRLQRRKDEAVAFLKKVMDKVREYQIKKGHKEVFLLDIPADLTHKRVFDLAEIIFYKGRYRIGKERRYWSQLILYMTQLFYFIHEDPDYLNASETARRLQNLLNFYATSAHEGRKGSEVRDVYMDGRGNMSENESELFNRRVRGLRKLKFSRREVSSSLVKQTIGDKTIATVLDANEKMLFPEGLSLMVRSRCKSPESLVLKYLKKGGKFDHDMIQDRVAFEFVIDERDLYDKFYAKNGHPPLPEDCKSLLSDAVKDLQLYLCDVWNISTFQEEDDMFVDQEQRENVVSSKRFKVNKMIFTKEVRGILMPIEVQIQPLSTKLMNESPDDEAAHTHYETKRVVQTSVLNYLFPEELFPEIGAIPLKVTEDLETTFAEDGASNT